MKATLTLLLLLALLTSGFGQSDTTCVDTFIVQALVAGLPAKLVADIVGNSVRVIEENYAWIAEEDLMQAAKRLDGDAFTTALLPMP